ncbi:Hypothetical predicted protein [Cloeon dipterum]|uniref:Uncharacterized protein n=1 Tax=Cloeon dipterum TaxID=197152 RepID=A0A8S1E3U5_9INSE|nr:Hypothetical predicted protein [Cloeon dipterum]
MLFFAFIHFLDCGKKSAIKTSHRSEQQSFIIKCCGRTKCSKSVNNKKKTGHRKLFIYYVLDMYKHCCPVGMKLMEPETTMDFILLRDLSTYFHVAFVGETRSSST